MTEEEKQKEEDTLGFQFDSRIDVLLYSTCVCGSPERRRSPNCTKSQQMLEIVNLKGHQNCIIGSKVTVIFVDFV